MSDEPKLKSVELKVLIAPPANPPPYVNTVAVQTVSGQVLLSFGFMHPTAIEQATSTAPPGQPGMMVVPVATAVAIQNGAARKLAKEILRFVGEEGEDGG